MTSQNVSNLQFCCRLRTNYFKVVSSQSFQLGNYCSVTGTEKCFYFENMVSIFVFEIFFFVVRILFFLTEKYWYDNCNAIQV